MVKKEKAIDALNLADDKGKIYSILDVVLSHEKDHIADHGKMVGDLISRQATLDALGERPMLWINNDEYTLGARNQYDMDRLAIETVPSAQPTDEDIQRMQDIEQAMLEKAYWFGKQDAQEWIPCSERLPGKHEYVLLACERNGKFVTDFGCLSPDIDGNLSWWIAAHDSLEGWRVQAWCPLPEVWKGEKHEAE